MSFDIHLHTWNNNPVNQDNETNYPSPPEISHFNNISPRISHFNNKVYLICEQRP